MKRLLTNRDLLFMVSAWILWTPFIFFCIHLLIEPRDIADTADYLGITGLSVLLFGCVFRIVGRAAGRADELARGEDTLGLAMMSQMKYGFLIPLLVIISVYLFMDVFLYKGIISIEYLKCDLLIILLFLFMINMYYLTLFIYHRRFSTEDAKILKEDDTSSVNQNKNYFPVEPRAVALIYREHQINWLVDFDSQTYLMDLPFIQVEAMLDADLFFRINRNEIVSRENIENFKPGSFGKITLSLKVRYGKGTVSKDRASAFRKWFHH